MAVFSCPHCGADIDEDEHDLDFRDEGFAFVIDCPFCDASFAPDDPDLRFYLGDD